MLQYDYLRVILYRFFAVVHFGCYLLFPVTFSRNSHPVAGAYRVAQRRASRALERPSCTDSARVDTELRISCKEPRHLVAYWYWNWYWCRRQPVKRSPQSDTRFLMRALSHCRRARTSRRKYHFTSLSHCRRARRPCTSQQNLPCRCI